MWLQSSVAVGCGVGWQLQLQLDPSPRISICAVVTKQRQTKSILLKLFQNTEEERILPNFMNPTLIYIKMRKRYHKKIKSQTQSPHKDRCKNPQQNISKLYPIAFLNSYLP